MLYAPPPIAPVITPTAIESSRVLAAHPGIHMSTTVQIDSTAPTVSCGTCAVICTISPAGGKTG